MLVKISQQTSLWKLYCCGYDDLNTKGEELKALQLDNSANVSNALAGLSGYLD